ncbi:MAG: hypothetical protein KDB00_16190, partial [Planctomycetales bacterium]|nr:hypothetical protein [Planctomycetales bacterium]
EASDETPSPDVAIDVSPEMPSDEASSTATEIRQVPSDDSIAESTADIARTFRTLLLASAHPNTRYQLSVSGIQLGTVATDSSGQLSIELTPVTTQQATTPSDDFQYVDTSAQATAEVDMNSVDVVPDDSQPESETNGSIDVTSNQVDRTDDLAEIQSIDIGLEFENSSSSDSFELATQAVDEVHSEAAIGNLWAPSNSTVEDSGASSSDDRERSGNDVDSVFDIEVDHELGGDFD